MLEANLIVNEVCTFSVNLTLTRFELFSTHLLLTVRSLKRYIYSRSAPLNLENQIQQGF
ncbi:MAG: hypothetical protein KME28_02125 [Pelatocladus maniniholoensis HA4357-MV3]|uniref:Uncharacterized protein n=1 Tax=Pelatocladus maniniholoensis HA4357-MV3 TaxID=1117104 RepID=A0A9E3LRJ8_9NOST|nr:hypothetical protein [Pelatocladus maniniholoensis HA4357-MV3]